MTKTRRGIFRFAFSLFLVVQILFGHVATANVVLAQSPLNTNTVAPANIPKYNQGVDQSIAQYLCVPDEANQGIALYNCISKMYRFGIAFGAIALVFFIVFAGYMYITGGETGKEKGKSVFLSALTGMAVILSSYVLLGFINPELTRIKPIQPPIFNTDGLPSCADVGLGEKCVLPDGQIGTGGGGGGTPGSANEAQYKALIAQYAPPNGLQYCHLSALIEKESSWIYNNVSNGPPHRVDLTNTSKYYGLVYTRGGIPGHGIGLGQVFIYGPPPHRSWTNSNTPSRDGKEFGFNKALTVEDLIKPEIGIQAMAYFFGKLVNDPRNKDNLRLAYDDYQSGAGDSAPPGRPDSQPETLDKYMRIYEACKRRGN